MKPAIVLIIIIFSSLNAAGQGGNKKPKIKGQDVLITNEDQSITIAMSYLDVEDPDDWFYPWGFTMQVYPGADYTLQGHTVIPAPNYFGKIQVPVTVHDGQDESNKFNLEITVNPVNDRPVITGHVALSTTQNQALMLQADHLKVSDPDNNYPDGFAINLRPGNNYTVNGSNIVPANDYSGTLSVAVSVNDGQAESDVYVLPVEVKIINRVPQITGQTALLVDEDGSVTLSLSNLIVVDQDSNYPAGFSMSLSSGQNYTFSNSTVTPSPDFFGRIVIPVTVNDGVNTSKPYDLNVTVVPVNDPPQIKDLETEPIYFDVADITAPISSSLVASDVDGDSIVFAEVGFRSEGYQTQLDKLVYLPTANNKIRAVFDSDSGILTLLGQASPASYSTALRSVHYEGNASGPGQDKVLFIKLNDGKTDGETYERRLVFGKRVVSLDIPTGFTPNGDLTNDTWKIIPLKTEEQPSSAQIRVYNKQGVLVYETVGFENEWDGRLNGDLLPADTYFYTIDLNTQTPEGYLKGPVTILR